MLLFLKNIGPMLLTLQSILLIGYPHLFVHNQTPFTKLFGRSPDNNNLHFGCLCYPWLRPYAPNKLAPRSKKCVFLGCSKLHKGYHCLDLSSGKMFISRHVVFYEQKFPFATPSDDQPGVPRSPPATIILPSPFTCHQ